MEELQVLVKGLAQKHGKSRESLLPILQEVCDTYKHLSGEAMLEIARELDLSTAEVYGTATFYSFLDTIPRGKFIIRVCKTIVCDMHGKKQIVKTLEDLLKIKVGETSLNKRFSLVETNCLGWCHKGPAMLINEEVFTDLNPDKVKNIIHEYRNR